MTVAGDRGESALYLPARAKLNLVLRVVGRRADGYHLLETLFHTIELHDDLWLQREPDDGPVTLEMTATESRFHVSTGPDNLIVRAIELVRDRASGRTGERPGFRARLHKRIPVGGGLGGGSSDAAAALRLSNALLGEPLHPGELYDIARTLGADVAFLLTGGSQWGQGVGDELSPAVVADRHFVLVVPPFECPTAEVYKFHAACWNDGGAQDTSSSASSPSTRGSALRNELSHEWNNDLRAAAETVRPELAALRQRVSDLGRVSVHLTGSGSTLFVACADEAAANDCANSLAPLAAAGSRVLRTCSAAQLDEPRWVAWPVALPPEPERRGG